MKAAEVIATNPYLIDTRVPFVGVIDFANPVEWLWWGGLALDLMVVNGVAKWIIAAGIITARYQVNQRIAT